MTRCQHSYITFTVQTCPFSTTSFTLIISNNIAYTPYVTILFLLMMNISKKCIMTSNEQWYATIGRRQDILLRSTLFLLQQGSSSTCVVSSSIVLLAPTRTSERSMARLFQPSTKLQIIVDCSPLKTKGYTLYKKQLYPSPLLLSFIFFCLILEDYPARPLWD